MIEICERQADRSRLRARIAVMMCADNYSNKIPVEISMKPEIIALIGVLVSSVIGGFVAFVVAAYRSKSDRASFEKQFDLQREIYSRGLIKERSERKIDIAYRFAELNQKDPDTALFFLNEVAKETAIGFLYFDDNDERSKIWIRNDANILIGRDSPTTECIWFPSTQQTPFR